MIDPHIDPYSKSIGAYIDPYPQGIGAYTPTDSWPGPVEATILTGPESEGRPLSG